MKLSHEGRTIGLKVQSALRNLLAAGPGSRRRPSPSASIARRIRVAAQDIAKERDGSESWWYVPVQVAEDPEYMSQIYEAMSDVEDRLASEGLTVLLVPRITPFARWSDNS